MSVRMPAEWEPHERMLMAWPVHESWGRHLEAARAAYADLANAIVDFEPLTMLKDSGEVEGARLALNGAIEIVEIPYEMAWMRDLAFNGWGERFSPWDLTAAATAGALVMQIPAGGAT